MDLGFWASFCRLTSFRMQSFSVLGICGEGVRVEGSGCNGPQHARLEATIKEEARTLSKYGVPRLPPF